MSSFWRGVVVVVVLTVEGQQILAALCLRVVDGIVAMTNCDLCDCLID